MESYPNVHAYNSSMLSLMILGIKIVLEKDKSNSPVFRGASCLWSVSRNSLVPTHTLDSDKPCPPTL